MHMTVWAKSTGCVCVLVQMLLVCDMWCGRLCGYKSCSSHSSCCKLLLCCNLDVVAGNVLDTEVGSKSLAAAEARPEGGSD